MGVVTPSFGGRKYLNVLGYDVTVYWYDWFVPQLIMHEPERNRTTLHWWYFSITVRR